ncbi:NAD(P)-dependent dehydrogenase (short-subunit alcohol dehydrogenase family) [Cytobacillus purgationiresistens]|uniref:NAD(P)-dependent dehydrogenase (Short-subunit alcohol dehydrogenase family) n=1 Tax=Cytobacillus purgationiresistens TaxID=863449 RepID=A0ABU0AJ99_9BACI|nr:NAD(P)-dependent dehydrogenase (short-subunit alcohol dehydrogenase family) [Cytobacillus purgationiresistens]
MHVAKDQTRINSIHPGFISTNLVKDNLDVEDLIAQEQVWRLGEPDEIAYCALYLASDESRFTTGTELVIDGGFFV